MTVIVNDNVALTQVEMDYLRSFLDTGDRSGFYMAYYCMTGQDQAAVQAQISSFRYKLRNCY